jgi:hypothetical protein
MTTYQKTRTVPSYNAANEKVGQNAWLQFELQGEWFAEPYMPQIVILLNGDTTEKPKSQRVRDLLCVLAELPFMPCRAPARYPVQASTPQGLDPVNVLLLFTFTRLGVVGFRRHNDASSPAPH